MTTNLKLMKNNAPSVIFTGDQVIIESLVIENEDLNAYMTGKPDPLEAFNSLLEAALYVRKVSNSSAEAEKLGAVAESYPTPLKPHPRKRQKSSERSSNCTQMIRIPQHLRGSSRQSYLRQ